MAKSQDAFRTIGEVSDELNVPKHVLRFWEARFPQIKPMKRGGGRRFYRPEDVALLRGIHHLLHKAGFTIRGVQRILKEQGVDVVKNAPMNGPPAAVLPAPLASKRAAKSPAATPASITAAQMTTLTKVARELEACLDMLRAPV